MQMEGRKVVISRRLVRLARLDADQYFFLDDPESALRELRRSGLKADLFTFVERLPGMQPLLPFPFEMDNFAALQLTSFDDWWLRQIGFKARNKAKQAGKRGVELREIPFDDAAVRGIWEIYNECPVRQGRRFSHFGKSIATV